MHKLSAVVKACIYTSNNAGLRGEPWCTPSRKYTRFPSLSSGKYKALCRHRRNFISSALKMPRSSNSAYRRSRRTVLYADLKSTNKQHRASRFELPLNSRRSSSRYLPLCPFQVQIPFNSYQDRASSMRATSVRTSAPAI